jgi:hypothetical protein
LVCIVKLLWVEAIVGCDGKLKYITSSSWSLHVFPLSLSLSIEHVDLDLVCVVKLPWVGAIVGCDGKLNMVHYKDCNEVDGKGKTTSI